MATNKTPARWWLLLIPVFAGRSFYFIDQSFSVTLQAKEPELLKSEWFTLTTPLLNIRPLLRRLSGRVSLFERYLRRATQGLSQIFW